MTWLLAIGYITLLMRTNSAYMLVCRYTRSSARRAGIAAYLPEDVPPALCTHIVFVFAKIKDDAIVRGSEKDEVQNGDKEQGWYARVIVLKRRNPNLKVLLSLGGPEANNGEFTSTVSSDSRRKRFARNALTYLRSWRFDGLDIDWEYPSGVDRERFTTWLQAIHLEFFAEAREVGQSALLLAIAASGEQSAVDHYEIDKLAHYVDFVHLTTYDFIETRRSKIRHSADLYAVNASITMWIDGGLPSRQLLIGVAAHGSSFIHPTSEPIIFERTSSRNDTPRGVHGQGDYTLSYREICMLVKNKGWLSEWDESALAPYAHKGDQWVSYDNPHSVYVKMDLIIERGLAGVVVVDMEQDDFGDLCGQGRYPIIGTMRNRLIIESNPQRDNPPLLAVTPLNLEAPKKKDYIVGCYFSHQLVIHRAYKNLHKIPKFIVPPDICTHIFLGFFSIKKKRVITWYWTKKHKMDTVSAVKAQNPSIVVLLTIGGPEAIFPEFASIVKQKRHRDFFLSHAIKFVRQNKYDGLNIDWQLSDPKFAPIYATWLKELRTAFDEEAKRSGRRRLMLTAAVMAGEKSRDYYDAKEISKDLDYVLLRTFDFTTTHTRPRFTGVTSPLPAVTWSVQDWIRRGAPRNKLVLGVPTHGSTFHLVSVDKNTSGSPFVLVGRERIDTQRPSIISYHEICLGFQDGWTDAWDDAATSPYTFKGQVWVGYENLCSLQHKNFRLSVTSEMHLLKEMGLGGAFASALESDDFRGTCGYGKFPLTSFMNSQLVGIRNTVDFQCAVRMQFKAQIPTAIKTEAPQGSPCRNQPAWSYQADPTSCLHYYYCTPHDVGLRSKCKNELQWNQETLHCDDPVIVNCTMLISDKSKKFTCDGLAAGDYPDPKSCHLYYACDKTGVAYRLPCPVSMYFNPVLSKCDDPNNVRCTDDRKLSNWTTLDLAGSATTLRISVQGACLTWTLILYAFVITYSTSTA